jgi:hypothetical protein
VEDSIGSEATRSSADRAPYYIALGIVFALEGNVIAMVHWLHYPWNLIVYAALCALTVRVCSSNDWLHKRLRGLKAGFASTERP